MPEFTQTGLGVQLGKVDACTYVHDFEMGVFSCLAFEPGGAIKEVEAGAKVSITFSAGEPNSVSLHLETDLVFIVYFRRSFPETPPIVHLAQSGGCEDKLVDIYGDPRLDIQSRGTLYKLRICDPVDGWFSTYKFSSVVFALKWTATRTTLGKLEKIRDTSCLGHVFSLERAKSKFTTSSPGPIKCWSLHHEEQGYRESMEDVVLALDEFALTSKQYNNTCTAATVEKTVLQDGVLSFYAVFDGHGGDYSSKYCGKKFPKIFREKFDACSEVREALWDACRQTDNDLYAELDKQYLPDSSGTTMCCVVIDQNGVVHCVNVGDSRAVLCRSGTAVPLSSDQKADNVDEIGRIVECGGFVSRGRVMGDLAVARAMGDYDFKCDEQYVITADPDIFELQLDCHDDEFIVVACDGLWDVMSSQEVISYCRGWLHKNMVPISQTDSTLGIHHYHRLLAELVEHAVENLGSSDNVSVILILLGDRGSADGKLNIFSKMSKSNGADLGMGNESKLDAKVTQNLSEKSCVERDASSSSDEEPPSAPEPLPQISLQLPKPSPSSISPSVPESTSYRVRKKSMAALRINKPTTISKQLGADSRRESVDRSRERNFRHKSLSRRKKSLDISRWNQDRQVRHALAVPEGKGVKHFRKSNIVKNKPSSQLLSESKSLAGKDATHRTKMVTQNDFQAKATRWENTENAETRSRSRSSRADSELDEQDRLKILSVFDKSLADDASTTNLKAHFSDWHEVVMKDDGVAYVNIVTREARRSKPKGWVKMMTKSLKQGKVETMSNKSKSSHNGQAAGQLNSLPKPKKSFQSVPSSGGQYEQIQKQIVSDSFPEKDSFAVLESESSDFFYKPRENDSSIAVRGPYTLQDIARTLVLLRASRFDVVVRQGASNDSRFLPLTEFPLLMKCIEEFSKSMGSDDETSEEGTSEDENNSETFDRAAERLGSESSSSDSKSIEALKYMFSYDYWYLKAGDEEILGPHPQTHVSYWYQNGDIEPGTLASPALQHKDTGEWETDPSRLQFQEINFYLDHLSREEHPANDEEQVSLFCGKKSFVLNVCISFSSSLLFYAGFVIRLTLIVLQLHENTYLYYHLQWYYKGDDDNFFGPFNLMQMRSWYSSGHLPHTLQIRKGISGDLCPLSDKVDVFAVSDTCNEWFYMGMDGIQGPFTHAQMSVWLQHGYLSEDLEVQRGEKSEWKPLGNYVGVGQDFEDA